MDFLEKRVALEDGEYLGEGEQRSVPLVSCRGRLEVDDRLSRGQVKTAASAEAIDAAAKVKPHPDRVYVLVIGLGSLEYWGVNNNGDSFPEAALLGHPPVDVPMSFFDKYRTRIKGSWGYETFRSAHAFQEHQNSHPRYAIGGIHDTFWNTRMHRVENIAWLDRKNPKGKKWVDRVDAGEPVGTSMACKVPFDRCSVCGNLAPTRTQYCNHLRLGAPGYALRKILPSGKAVSMINDMPVFFDESFVETPAAPEALMIMKVASQTAKSAQEKQAEIKKQGPDLPMDVALDDFRGLYESEPTLPTPVVEKLATLGLVNVIKAANGLGICLRPSEVFGMQFGLEKFASGELETLDSACPWVTPYEVKVATQAVGIFDHLKVARAVDLLKPFCASRSYQEPFITGRLLRKLAKVQNIQATHPSAQTEALIGLYHTLYKAASGEFGYGLSQLKSTAMSRHGGY